MRSVRLGRTGVEVSAISLGTWSHGGPKQVRGRPVGWSGHDEEQALAALERAAELGITHWDTADVYGDGAAERLIARALRRVPRERLFLASKVGWDPGSHEHAYDPRQIRARLERSLRYLGAEAIDLYYFHHCDFGPGDRYLDDALATLHQAREEGKLRWIGLSDWNPAKVARLAPRVDPDVVQPYRNVLDDSYRESGLATWVERADAGVAFFSPLKHGLLLGKYTEPTEFPEGDMRAGVQGFRDPDLIAHLRRCRAEVEARFAGEPQPVLRAVLGVLLADAPTGCVLVGMRDPRQAEAAAAAGEPLDADEAAWVRRLYRR